MSHSHAGSGNYSSSSLFCSEDMLKVCVEFALFSLFALLNVPTFPILPSLLSLSKSCLEVGCRKRGWWEFHREARPKILKLLQSLRTPLSPTPLHPGSWQEIYILGSVFKTDLSLVAKCMAPSRDRTEDTEAGPISPVAVVSLFRVKRASSGKNRRFSQHLPIQIKPHFSVPNN